MGDKRKLMAAIMAAIAAYLQMETPPKTAPQGGSK
jgi:hypothetical protein